jgi:hypothetical protein
MRPNVLRDFFKLELETLQAKTGIRQLDNIMAKEATWEAELSQLLDLLVAECNRPPFDLVGVDIKMKVIRDALISDKEFMGLSARFVHKSLTNWWQFNGGRYLEKHMQSMPPEPKVDPETGKPVENYEPAPPEVREKYLKEWVDSLKEAGDKYHVPVLTAEEIQSEGQVEPKKPTYVPDEAYYYESKKRRYEFQEKTVRERHPEWTEEQVQARLKELRKNDV